MKLRAKIGVWVMALLCAHLFFHPLTHKLVLDNVVNHDSVGLVSVFDPSSSEEQCGVCNVLHSLAPALLMMALPAWALLRRISAEQPALRSMFAPRRLSGRAPPSLL